MTAQETILKTIEHFADSYAIAPDDGHKLSTDAWFYEFIEKTVENQKITKQEGESFKQEYQKRTGR